MRFRSELRRSVVSWVALALVVGVAAGSVIALAAAARRTDSAYRRFAAGHAASSLILAESSDFVGAGRLDLDVVAGLPQVAASARVATIFIGAGRTEDGRPLRAGEFVPMAPADESLGRTVNRWKLLEGRRADQSRVDEVVLSFEAARENDLAIGDTFRVRFVPQASFLRVLPAFFVCIPERVAGDPTPACRDVGLPSVQDGPDLRFRVVGIEASTTEFPPLPGNVLPPVHMTRAFTERYASDLARSDILYVRLRPDATAKEFLAAAQALYPDTTITVYSDGVDNAATVSRSIHFQAIGLGILALLVGLSVTFALAQAFGRQAYSAVDVDAPVLRALGLRDRQFLVLAAIRAGVTAVTGALLATVVAVALSPLWPVGLAATAEPTPGVATDSVALGVGVVVILVVAVFGAILGTLPLVRRSARRSARRRRTGLARALPTTLPVPAAVGVRHALDPGRGRTAVPVRSAALATALTVAALVAAVTYAASTDHLLDTRRLYGWTHDVQIGSTGLPAVAPPVVEGLAERADVEAVAAGTVVELTVEGERVTGYALDDVVGEVPITLVEGRRPRTTDEIVLGSTTLRRIGRDVGDTVSVRVADAAAPMRVVGRAVFPRIGDNGQLGRGARITFAALQAFVDDPSANVVHAEFVPGTDVPNVRADLRRAMDAVPVLGPIPPTDVTTFGGADALPVAVASVMLLVTATILAHVLVTSLRRRRYDFAVLEVLGFVRRQRSLAVAAQATTLAVVALAIGIPVGWLLGRWGWDAIARELGVPSEPRAGAAVIAAVAVGLLVLANVVAVVPAWLARRTHAAEALRAG